MQKLELRGGLLRGCGFDEEKRDEKGVKIVPKNILHCSVLGFLFLFFDTSVRNFTSVRIQPCHGRSLITTLSYCDNKIPSNQPNQPQLCARHGKSGEKGIQYQKAKSAISFWTGTTVSPARIGTCPDFVGSTRQGFPVQALLGTQLPEPSLVTAGAGQG